MGELRSDMIAVPFLSRVMTVVKRLSEYTGLHTADFITVFDNRNSHIKRAGGVRLRGELIQLHHEICTAAGKL